MNKKIIIIIVAFLIILGSFFSASYYFMTLVTEPVVESYETIHNRLINDVGVDVEKISLEKTTLKTSDNFDIETLVYRNPNPSKKVVVLSHGIKQNAYEMFTFFEMYREAGFDIVSFSYRNHGNSTKGFTTFGKYEVEDLDTAMDYAHKTFGDSSLYGIHGVSMGAAVTLQYAGLEKSQGKYDFIISDCAFSTLSNELQYRLDVEYKAFAWLPLIKTSSFISKTIGRMDYNEIKPVDKIQNINTPILIVHGTGDEYIKISESELLFNAAKEPKTFLKVENAAHAESYKTNQELYKKTFNDFISTLS